MSLDAGSIDSAVSFKDATDPRESRRLRARRSVEVLLALLLLAAAGLKAYQLFGNSGFVIPGFIHSKAILAVVIQMEILLSSWLLIGGFARGRFIVAIICFALFAFIASFEALHALPSCGCFGNVKVPPTATAVWDILAVMALWITRPRWRWADPPSPSRRLVFSGVAVAVLSAGALWTGYSLKVLPRERQVGPSSAGDGDLVVLEPRSWLNKPFGLLGEIDRSDSLRHGRWLILFYHFDCDSCLEAIPRYMSIATSMTSTGVNGPRVAFIAMPPVAPAGQDPVSPSSDYSRLVLRPDHDWFATTPVVAAIEDGSVLWADEGEIAVHPPTITQWR